MQKIYSPAYRVRRAYATALRVTFSYLWLGWMRRLRGRRWYERRIGPLHIRNAERVKKTILELKGLFIKVGQLLSIMSNFLPEAFQKPLEALQDRMPAQPYEAVRKRILEELGKTPEELFAFFNPEPIATASIGQAHRARLHDGTEVVVKVQHYGIEGVAAVDLDIIQRLTKLGAWFFDIKGMDYLYTQIRKMIEEELDFDNEARAMTQIAAQLSGESKIKIPFVHPEYSTGRVMTTTFHAGVKITETEQLDAWGIERRELLGRLFQAWCQMVFRDGYYHADPHPGNLLVEPDGTLVLLDFGATATLPPNMREGITELIEAAVKNNQEEMIDACRKIGLIADGPDAERMAKRMINAMRNFIQNEVEFEGLNFRDIKVNPFNNSLADLIRDIGFRGISSTVQVPKEYVLLNRTITLLLGISNSLDPGFNPLEVVRPFMRDYILKKQGGSLGYIRNVAKRTLMGAISLPDEVQRTLRKVRAGDTEVRQPDTERAAKLIAKSLRKLSYAVLAAALTGAGAYAHATGLYEAARYAWIGAACLGVLAVWR
ncbi:MAG: AarF/ABC1/UbiB kinase family protein [Chitinophagales bacterium]|nr:AarF/ABC1/UbiB kinase family protein [Chitinophagales bacterium]